MLFHKRAGAIADQRKTGPINWSRLVTEFFEEIDFGLLERRSFVIAVDEMLIKA